MRFINIVALHTILSFVGSVTAQPYVFYKGDQVIVANLETNTVQMDSFPLTAKEQHKVAVRFSDKQGWDFEVPFKRISTDAPVSKGTDKILFLSDIEGEFDHFRSMLLANKVIDERYNWIFGVGQLVVCGDLFDRGSKVTQLLWLLYKLEAEAERNGGFVHVILGNHDIMNKTGDWRYVQPIYLAQAKLLGKEYGQLFDQDSELGRWLGSKNIIEKIGDHLCMHGGFSRTLLDRNLSIKKLNSIPRPYFQKGEEKELPDEVIDFYNENALFWYRGYFTTPLATEGQVDSTLDSYRVRKIIVGHTILKQVSSYYNGKVIGIDTDWHAGNAQGLFYEKKKYYRVDIQGNKSEL